MEKKRKKKQSKCKCGTPWTHVAEVKLDRGGHAHVCVGCRCVTLPENMTLEDLSRDDLRALAQFKP